MATHIISIGTAVPENKISQKNILNFMSGVMDLTDGENKKLEALYRSTGIKTRHSVLSDYGNTFENFSFFPKNKFLEPSPSIGPRMAIYKKYALPLCVKAINDCGVYSDKKNEITHIITVSCTGMYAPGLDIEIINELKLPANTQRTSVNFMGCYAAINALRIADYICKSDKNATVLLVCVELCTIHFQKTKGEDAVLSNALFADGAAAMLVSNNNEVGKLSLAIETMYSEIINTGQKDMAWHINDFGFEMVLSSYVPEIIRGGIRKLCDKLLENIQIKIADISFFAIHPGGKKILEVIEKELSVPKVLNQFAYNILSNYGNMSSPTVLFVLKELMESIKPVDEGKNILSLAFGPGLTMESALFKINF